MIAALAYWGFTLDQPPVWRLVAGIGAIVVAVLVWGRWVAPKSDNQLDDPVRFVVELVLFAATAVALMAAGQTVLAIVLISVYLLDRIALTLTGGTGL